MERWPRRTSLQISAITGGGLLVPETHELSMSDFSLTSMSAAYMTIEVLFGFSIEHEKIDGFLAEHEIEAVLTECSLLLGQLYEGRSPGDRTTQRQLVNTYLVGEVRSKALEILEGDNWVFISPQLVLSVIKLRLLGPRVPTTSTPSMNLRTTVIMAVLAVATELGRDRTHEAERLGGMPRSLAMEFFSNQLFNRNLDIGAEIARFKRHRTLVQERFSDETRKFDQLFTDYTGTTVEALFCVGCYTVFRQRQDHVVELPIELFFQLNLERGVIQSAIDLLATDQEHLASLLRRDSRRLEFAWSFNSLRRFPMLKMSNGHLLILNPAFVLVRALSTAYFWEIKSRSIDVIEEGVGDVPEANKVLGVIQ
jgi:hypothetical protein